MPKKKVNIITRLILAAVLFIVGLTVSNGLFFDEYPIFGQRFLAEILVASSLALFGYYLVPRYYLMVKNWVEQLIVRTTYKMASDFWNQYTTRMEQSRKQREKERKKKNKQKKKQLKDKINGGVALDTSILIDGRIVEIAKTGFLPEPIVVPKYVINELHLLSDNEDSLTRKKGRRGLDMINELKKVTKVKILGSKATSNGVDEELVHLAKDCDLKLMTLDYNLNKVAQVNNVKVLNINDLSEAIKPAYVPGDTLNIKIIQEGKEKNQGVGYLEDGTMIVVDKADKMVDQTIDVVVSKLIQTSAGKMVFCELNDKKKK